MPTTTSEFTQADDGERVARNSIVSVSSDPATASVGESIRVHSSRERARRVVDERILDERIEHERADERVLDERTENERYQRAEHGDEEPSRGPRSTDLGG